MGDQRITKVNNIRKPETNWHCARRSVEGWINMRRLSEDGVGGITVRQRAGHAVCVNEDLDVICWADGRAVFCC